MITKIDTNLPTSTNKKIINTLFTTSLWTHAWDKNSHHNINNPDSGMALMSFQNNETQHTPPPILNVYAGVIFDLVQKNSLIKFKIFKSKKVDEFSSFLNLLFFKITNT